MELREYLEVVRRRLLLVTIVFGLTVVASLALIVIPRNDPASGAVVSTVIAIQPSPVESGGYYTYDGYYAYQTAELLAEDIEALLESGRFLGLLRSQAPELSAAIDESRIEVIRRRGVLTIEVSSRTSEMAQAVSERLLTLLSAPDGGIQKLLESVGSRGARLTVVFPPALLEATASRSLARTLLDFGLRALVGLIAGIALAFFVDYVDDTYRGRRDVESLGLPVIGEVPVGDGSSPSRRRA